MRARTSPRTEIAQALLPANMQFKIDSLLDASRRWSDAELRRALAELDRADRRMKRGADAATTLRVGAGRGLRRRGGLLRRGEAR